MANGELSDTYDVIIVGGGHNGLTAAAYLARAGLSVLVLERLDHVGGAAVSTKPFAGLPAKLSQFSSVVNRLPRQIVTDLDLDLRLRSRPVTSYTPVVREGSATGLLVERPEARATEESFLEVTGSGEEYASWRRFNTEVSEFAEALAPTLLEPLRTARDARSLVDSATWDYLVEEPLGAVIEDRFHDDTVRGVVACDALRGTFASLNDEAKAQNRSFLHHRIGNGTGEWKVPVGGMGALTDALAAAARNAGAHVVTGAGASGIETDGFTATVTWHDEEQWRTAACDQVLANVAPWVLQVLLGGDPGERPEGSGLTVHLLVERLPRLLSGVTPKSAFGGTCHIAAGYHELEEAYRQAASGVLPARPPGEIHCHSLTDPSILGPLAVKGLHTLTFAGVHAPARLFESDVAEQRDLAVGRALDALNEHLEEPVESLLTLDRHDRPCLKAMAPQDVDQALGMPGGHMFHGDVAWPWAPNRARLDTPAQRWGVATEFDNVLLCGSGARRGGAVSGIGGHNAAQAVLEARSR